MVLLPVLNPLLNPLQIPLHVIRTITPQLLHNLLLVRLARLIQQHLHNLTVHVLIQLLILVTTGGKTIVQNGGVASQDNDEVDPALGEEVARVPVEDVAAFVGEGEGF
jgi:hypothetical protein